MQVQVLKDRIKASGMSMEKISEMIGIDPSTMYRKIQKGGDGFTIKETNALAEVLKLSSDDALDIFFRQ
jgi:predicted transcriptional regulator